MSFAPTIAPTYDLAAASLVVARVPSLPIDVALRVLSAADPLESARAFYAGNAFARAAVAVSSPSLAIAIDEWIAGKPSRNAKIALRALSVLIRMSARPTPFGLFAGIAPVELAERTTLTIRENALPRPSVTRPDMELLCELASSFEGSDAREHISYSTNDAAFVRGGRLYVTNIALVNYAPQDDLPRMQQREVSLNHTDAVAFVRDCCGSPMRYGSIVARLCERFGATEVPARSLLDRLIEAGVVVSELRASPVGDPVSYLLDRFEALGAPFATSLRAGLAEADRIDAAPLRTRCSGDYTALQATLSALVSTPSHAIQVDSRAPLTGTLNAAILDDAACLAESFVRMGRTSRLDAFRKRFVECYEGMDRMVPLLELVDNNLGLGVPETSSLVPADPDRDAFVMRMVCESMRGQTEEIVLEGDVLERFAPSTFEPGSLPTSLEVAFTLVAQSPQEVDRGNYQMLAGFVSDGALKTLGRFAHLFDERVATRMAEVAKASVPSGQIVAEFAYAPPSARAYNVSIRPALLGREIRAGIGAPAQRDTIELSDLWVGLENDRFFLWSRSLARRVTVRETHALVTTANAPNLCRLLALLHADGKRFPSIDWGPAHESTYLPRLRRGRVVLSPRRWRFSRADFGAGEAQARRALERARDVWGLPRYVNVCDDDNRLLLDLDSSVTPALFADQAGLGFVTIEEALAVPSGTWILGNDGSFSVEMIAQAACTATSAAPPPPLADPAPIERPPAHGPGSQWVYAKLYLGAQATDGLIVNALGPLIEELRAGGAIDRWFFVRYGDPRDHLRVRFRAAHSSRARDVRERFLERAETWLTESKLLRYTLDTYDPEYERYGGIDAMDDVERFFTHDSDVCAAIIARGIDDLDPRIEAAVTTFDSMLPKCEQTDRLVLDAFAHHGRRKLIDCDRQALRRVASHAPGDAALLDAILSKANAQKCLAALVHMHCNRLALFGESEHRVAQLLRCTALARVARGVAVV